MYNKLITGQVSADAVCLENVLDRLNGKLEEQKVAIVCHSNERIWLQYIYIYYFKKYMYMLYI